MYTIYSIYDRRKNLLQCKKEKKKLVKKRMKNIIQHD